MTLKKDQPQETFEIDRRQFLTTTAAVGGGMVLGFWLPPKAQAMAQNSSLTPS